MGNSRNYKIKLINFIMKYPRINYIEILENYKIFVIFNNGQIKIYSVSNLLNEKPFTAFRDKNLFLNAKKEQNGYGIIWNDEIDISEYEIWKNGKNIINLKNL